MEDSSAEYDDLENKSDVSDSTFTRSIGSSSSNQFDSTYHPGDIGGKVWALISLSKFLCLSLQALTQLFSIRRHAYL